MTINTVLFWWPLLLIIGVALRMGLRYIYGARGPDADDYWHAVFNVLSWLCLILGIVPAVLFAGASILGLVLIVLGIATFLEADVERHAMYRRSMCTMLAMLIERKTPLEPSILLDGGAIGGVVGQSGRELFEDLRRGAPLTEAIGRHPKALPREAVAYAAVGAEIGAEAAALRELSSADDRDLAALTRNCVDRTTYLAVILATMFLVGLFVMIKIVPNYQKIFQDFDMELPSVTWYFIETSRFVGDYLALPLVALLVMGSLALIAVALLVLSDVHVCQPIADRLFRARRFADVLRILAVATEHRQPLASVFDRLAQVYPSGFIRRQLQRIASYVAAGDDWRRALLDQRFVSPAECALLTTAEQVNSLPWALRTVARRKEKRLIYRWTAAVQVAYPCAILLVGASVAFFMLAMFSPLVGLIEGLAG